MPKEVFISFPSDKKRVRFICYTHTQNLVKAIYIYFTLMNDLRKGMKSLFLALSPISFKWNLFFVSKPYTF